MVVKAVGAFDGVLVVVTVVNMRLVVGLVLGVLKVVAAVVVFTEIIEHTF